MITSSPISNHDINQLIKGVVIDYLGKNRKTSLNEIIINITPEIEPFFDVHAKFTERITQTNRNQFKKKVINVLSKLRKDGLLINSKRGHFEYLGKRRR